MDIVQDTPPPLLSKFFQLGHCPGQGISDIVRVRVSNWKAADFPLESLVFSLRTVSDLCGLVNAKKMRAEKERD